MWYYDENGKFVLGVKNKRGVRQGCVMGMFLFCITMEPVYVRMRETMGEDGVLYTYCDDSYLLAPAEQMATVHHQATFFMARWDFGSGTGLGKLK